MGFLILLDEHRRPHSHIIEGIGAYDTILPPTGIYPKCGKHGLTQAEIEEVFAGTPAVLADPFPDETRMRAIGKSAAGRYVFVVFMLREIDGQTKLRPLHAPEGDRTL